MPPVLTGTTARLGATVGAVRQTITKVAPQVATTVVGEVQVISRTVGHRVAPAPAAAPRGAERAFRTAHHGAIAHAAQPAGAAIAPSWVASPSETSPPVHVNRSAAEIATNLAPNLATEAPAAPVTPLPAPTVPTGPTLPTVPTLPAGPTTNAAGSPDLSAVLLFLPEPASTHTSASSDSTGHLLGGRVEDPSFSPD